MTDTDYGFNDKVFELRSEDGSVISKYAVIDAGGYLVATDGPSALMPSPSGDIRQHWLRPGSPSPGERPPTSAPRGGRDRRRRTSRCRRSILTGFARGHKVARFWLPDALTGSIPERRHRVRSPESVPHERTVAWQRRRSRPGAG